MSGNQNAFFTRNAGERGNPVPTVDVVIYDEKMRIVLIERANPPPGFALPGGFMDVGESAESAAIREAWEETALHVELIGLLGVYSRPDRDPRLHTISVVFTGRAENPGDLRAGDDAAHAALYPLDALPALAFDHALILRDFAETVKGARNIIPVRRGDCGL